MISFVVCSPTEHLKYIIEAVRGVLYTIDYIMDQMYIILIGELPIEDDQ